MKLPEIKLEPVRIAEAAPSAIFLLLWRTGQDPQMAGWVGCGLATLLLGGFLILRRRFHPIMLGINIHLLLAAPVINGIFEAGYPDAGRFLVEYAETGVIVVVFLTGIALTFLSRGGFLGEPDVAWHIRWRFSLLMLILAGGMIPFSITNHELPLLAVAGPILVLFLLRGYLAKLALGQGDPS